MNEMNRKKLYIWKLAAFLGQNGMIMSVEELADHLNRNNFKTSYDTPYEGKRGTYRLVKATYDWVHEELGLPDDAGVVALAFRMNDGTPAWDK
jgi:hypothetical protein